MLNRLFVTVVTIIGLCVAFSPSTLAQDAPITGENTMPQTGYAAVNGLEMYYEIHGTGEPLIVLHGAYSSIPSMGEIVPRLAANRQVIAPELQGHGRTADIDRPLRYESMADDVAALMESIGVEQADIFGYSMGGGTALQLAIRHPERVRKLVVASTSISTDGWHPGLMEAFSTFTPEAFAGSPMEAEYASLAPNPEDFPRLVEKLIELDTQEFHWSPEDIQAVTAPTLLIFGDADIVTLEHVVEMFRLRGGGVNGDFTGLPNAWLAVLPGTTHVGVMMRPDRIEALITDFLDAPAQQPPQ